jgi:hypothetical protein
MAEQQQKIPPEVDLGIAIIASGCGLTVLVIGLAFTWFVWSALSR